MEKILADIVESIQTLAKRVRKLETKPSTPGVTSSPGTTNLGASRLSELLDVGISQDPADFNEVLTLDQNTGKWEGRSVARGLRDLTDVDIVTTPPLNQHFLMYDEPSGKWIASDVTELIPEDMIHFILKYTPGVPVQTFEVSDVGLAAALTTEDGEDHVDLPGGCLIFGDFTIPSGLTLGARGENAWIFGTVTVGNNSKLTNIIVYNQGSGDRVGIIGPDGGSCYITHCRIFVRSTTADAIAIKGDYGDMYIQDCTVEAIGVTAAAIESHGGKIRGRYSELIATENSIDADPIRVESYEYNQEGVFLQGDSELGVRPANPYIPKAWDSKNDGTPTDWNEVIFDDSLWGEPFIHGWGTWYGAITLDASILYRIYVDLSNFTSVSSAWVYTDVDDNNNIYLNGVLVRANGPGFTDNADITGSVNVGDINVVGFEMSNSGGDAWCSWSIHITGVEERWNPPELYGCVLGSYTSHEATLGDRSAWDAAGFPSVHANDIDNDGIHHTLETLDARFSGGAHDHGTRTENVLVSQGATSSSLKDSHILDGISGSYQAEFSGVLTGNKTYEFQDKDGTVILDSDVREKLTSNRTYYVRTDGSDSNDGLSNTAGGAFLTVQKAIDTAATLDQASAYSITIQIADGTYNESLTLKNVAGNPGSGFLTITGNSGDSTAVKINASTGSCIFGSGLNVIWTLSYLDLATAGTGACVRVDFFTTVVIDSLNFSESSGYHMMATYSGLINIVNNYTISGGAIAHKLLQGNSVIVFSSAANRGVFTADCTFSTAFVMIQTLSFLRLGGYTVGAYTITGKQFAFQGNVSINVSDPFSVFPGTVTGTWQTEVNVLGPNADSTSGIVLSKSNKTTPVVIVDTTNNRLGVGQTPPAYRFEADMLEPVTETNGILIANTGMSELITDAVNRQMDSGAAWTGTNWSVTGGALVHTPGSSTVATLANSNLTSGSILSGRYYIVTFTCTVSAGNLAIRLGTASSGSISASGTYTVAILATANNADLNILPLSTFDGSIDNVSLYRVPAKFYVSPNGHVGIGTTSPDSDSWLHIVGYDPGTKKLKISNDASGSGVNSAVEVRVGASGGRVLLIYGSPEVSSTTFAAFSNRGALITDTTVGNGISLASRQASGDIRLYTGGVANTNERMIIDSSGNVGFGTSSPSSVVDVAGNVEIGSSNYFYMGDPTTDGSWRIGRNGDNLVMERRESGSWVTKSTITP